MDWGRGHAMNAKKEKDKLIHVGNKYSASLKKAINQKGTHSCHLESKITQLCFSSVYFSLQNG